jgi:hypothetical protein
LFFVYQPLCSEASLVAVYTELLKVLRSTAAFLLDKINSILTGDFRAGCHWLEGILCFPSGLTAPGGSLSFKVGKGKGFDFLTRNNFSHSLYCTELLKPACFDYFYAFTAFAHLLK